MQKYQIIVLDQVFDNLQETLNYIKKDSVANAIKFRSGVLKTIEQLEFFPESGKNLIDDLKAKVYKGRLIVYLIDNRQHRVIVSDFVDPTQDSKATKYFEA